MECKVCFESYNDLDRKPWIIVNCGHTFCKKCLTSLKNRKCPGCRTDISGMPGTQVNYVILGLLLQKSEKEDNSLFKDSLYNFLIKDIEKESNKLTLTHTKKLNECSNLIVSIRTKIQHETEKKIETILKQNEYLVKELVDLETKLLSDINEIILDEQENIKSETNAIQNSLTNEIDLNQVNILKEKSVEIQEKLNLKIKNLENLDLNFDFEPVAACYSEPIGKIIFQKKSNEKHTPKEICVKSEKNLNATILSGSSDNTIKIWDACNGQLLRTIAGHSNAIRALLYLPDDTVASASVDKTIRIWNPNNGDLIRELIGHTESVLCLTLLNDELYVASGSADKTIIIWNTSENKIIRKLISHSAEVYSLCVIENGTKLASGSYKEIKIWNVFSGQLLNTLTGYFYHVYSLVQLENGCLVSSGGFSINIWNLNNVIKSSIILDEQKNTILSLAILSDDRLASGSSDSIVRIWNINTCALIKALKGHGQGVWSLTVLPDEKLASASLDKTIIIWSIKNGTILKTLTSHSYGVWSVVMKDSCRI